jgi:type 1 fimbria pilin
MAHKDFIGPITLVSGQSLATSFSSASTACKRFSRIAYQVTWTGTAVGTLIAQGSLDNQNFSDLDMNQIVLNNASDSGVLDIQTTAIPFVRLNYTSTSGTGSMTILVSAKEG